MSTARESEKKEMATQAVFENSEKMRSYFPVGISQKPCNPANIVLPIENSCFAKNARTGRQACNKR
jgi:hypothetical protein